MKKHIAYFSLGLGAGIAFFSEMALPEAALPKSPKDFVTVDGPLFAAGTY